ncbi:flavodoxin [Celerinatantimonas yamalensis]|uniref:Flavodoxin n=1 Tax=Celerinatantimonas yamalensis TaxID=559956 RepID=A0ABW9G3S1_9GAMM
MTKVGIFFGTDTGNTRKVAKWIHQALGDEQQVAKPLNINRVTVADLLAFDALILGTPTLGEGELPGLETQCEAPSWQEFVPMLDDADFSGKTIALFGLGDQLGYGDEFVDALGELYDRFADTGAKMIGNWPADGYHFTHSAALDGDEFVGLVIDQDNQAEQTSARIEQWISQIKPALGL